MGVNDFATPARGKTVIKRINSKGTVAIQQEIAIRIDPLAKKIQPCLIELPKEKGGYLLVADYYTERKTEPAISRRYLKIGDSKDE